MNIIKNYYSQRIPFIIYRISESLMEKECNGVDFNGGAFDKLMENLTVKEAMF